MIHPRRVVVTGIGLCTPLGNSLPDLMDSLYAGRSGITKMPEWASAGLNSLLAAPVKDFDEKQIPRQLRRSMSRVAQFATVSTGRAIADADLADDLVRSDRTGISYGSTMGGTSALENYFRSVTESGSFVAGVMSTTFLQIMSHTCAANIAVAFNIPGRVTASCTACAAGTQAIGFGYEAIRFGRADRMICGGAEELSYAVSGVFDVMRATSTKFNERPSETPRPFAADRDGIVVGEGAGTFVLEDYDSAMARGARIYAEIVGFCTNTDASHMTNPSSDGMAGVMKGALQDAGLAASDISYVNAHATATTVGDIAESTAISRIFGEKMPVSSLKGHFGHLMGACGSVETAASIGMMKDQRLVHTLNLSEVDEKCGKLDYIRYEPRNTEIKYVVKNSFAFGGINATLVLARML